MTETRNKLFKPMHWLFILLMISCIFTKGEAFVKDTSAVSTTATLLIPEKAIEGDYNGDGITEYMWLVAPIVIEDESGCFGDCVSYIRFSNPAIPEIKVDNCIGGQPVNKGDLNRNGSDEIGLLPEWFTSCWQAYYVWTLLDGKWVYAVAPFSTHCIQWEKEVNPIEIDPLKKENVIIRYSEYDQENTDITIKTKSVPVAR